MAQSKEPPDLVELKYRTTLLQQAGASCTGAVLTSLFG